MLYYLIVEINMTYVPKKERESGTHVVFEQIIFNYNQIVKKQHQHMVKIK